MSFAMEEQQAIFERAFPISVEAYHLLYKQGHISEKTELLEGKYSFTKILQKDERFISNIIPEIAFSLNDFLPQI